VVHEQNGNTWAFKGDGTSFGSAGRRTT
jgi:hypothetical protein